MKNPYSNVPFDVNYLKIKRLDTKTEYQVLKNVTI